MLRRALWVAAGLTVALAVPAAAQAKWLVRLPKKPKKVHVIAIKRGHHIIWKQKNHGLAKHRLNVRAFTLSTDIAFRASIRAANPANIQTYSGMCPPTGSESLPLDGTEFYLPYGTTNAPYSDVLTCSGGGYNPPQLSYGPVPLQSGGPGCAFPAENQNAEMPINTTKSNFVNAEYVWFLDGEWGVICTVPDDNGAGVSQAGADPLQVYQQGFKCQVPVATGGSSLPTNLRNSDSIELYQSLGNKVYSVTTTCIGKLPSNVKAPSTDTTHWLGCLEPNPFPGGPSLKGYGSTVTFADGQYSETCSVPNYKAS
jgi:hypothetical protein